MMTCETLSEVDAHLTRACGRLGLRPPVAVRSGKYDRIDIYMPCFDKDDEVRLRDALAESLRETGAKWDVWIATDEANTMCAAPSETPEDSE